LSIGIGNAPEPLSFPESGMSAGKFPGKIGGPRAELRPRRSGFIGRLKKINRRRADVES